MARRFFLLLLAFLVPGCASMRSVSVGSEEGGNYSIDVTNPMSHSMTVFWTDGGEPKQLGTVAANRTERFVIASPRTTTISVTARQTTGGHSTGPYSVTLVAGSAQKITLR